MFSLHSALETQDYWVTHNAQELHQIVLRCRENWQNWQKFYFVTLFYMRELGKWRELPDNNGEPYPTQSLWLKDIAQETKVSVNYIEKTLNMMRIVQAQGYDPATAAELSINSIDDVRSWIETDRRTGEILRLTPAAEKNLPLPDSSPGERVVAAMQDISELSPGEARRYAAQVSGDVAYRVIPTLLTKDAATGYWRFEYRQVDDLNETHVEIVAISRTPQGNAWIQRLLGGAEL